MFRSFYFPSLFCNDLCFICCLYHRENLFANCFFFVLELLKCEMIEKNDCTDTPEQQIRIKDHFSFFSFNNRTNSFGIGRMNCNIKMFFSWLATSVPPYFSVRCFILFIVSLNGTATATFTVNPVSVNTDTAIKSPKTSDQNHLILWITLLCLSSSAGILMHNSKQK